MASNCLTCTHKDRLAIDQKLVQGQSYSSIGREYNLPMMSVRNHAHNHLSRQLMVAWDRKETVQSMELMEKLREVLDNAQSIFKRNFDQGRDNTALRAIDSIRLTLELVARISAYVAEAKRAEAQTQAPDFQTFLEQEEREQAQRACDRLNEAEMDLYIRLINKIEGHTNEVIIPDDRPDFNTITYNLDNPEYGKDPTEFTPEPEKTFIDFDSDFGDLPPKPTMRRTK